MTWTGSNFNHVTKSPLAVPAAATVVWPDAEHHEQFNAMKGGISIFVVRGDYLDPNIMPEVRERESTDPPMKFRTASTEFPRVMRWDWFRALPTPLGNATCFEYHNEWVNIPHNDRKESVRQMAWLLEHQVISLSGNSAAEAATGVKRPCGSEETTPMTSNKRTRRSLPRSSRSSSGSSRAFSYGDDDNVDDDQPHKQETPVPDMKKEVIVIPDDDEIVQSLFPTVAPPVPTILFNTAISSKMSADEGEIELKFKLESNIIRQRLRRKALLRQDPNINLEIDDELDMMLLEENEIRHALYRLQKK